MVSVTSAKQEQEETSGCLRIKKSANCRHHCPVLCLSTLCILLLVSCVALSVLYNTESESTPEWRSLLFDYQNISDNYPTLTESNFDLRGENEVLKKQNLWLDEQNNVLNKTSTRLVSLNAALSSQSNELMEQIVNLTSANLQLTQEHERLVRFSSELEEEKVNMSDTIKRLIGFNAQQEEDRQRLSQLNSLLRDELLQTREENQEMSNTFQEEFKQLQERVSELQEENQNMSTVLINQRQEAAEQERSRMEEMKLMEADLNSTKEAYHCLDFYCPVVNHKTKERICRQCPYSWKLFQAKCYYFSSRTLTWSSSRAWCQTQGGDLLIVNSKLEQIFVFESSLALQQSSSSSSSRLWIGLTDAEVEGQWLWVDSSEVTNDVQ
ncbi:C-type lectin domain family 4 member M-like [Parambassis ranga]|uniref:C-type lectin domain family 4 member M-like n=1 Tax=Parambassis ranga TaxID=210632 RepID=A0A6P7K9F4_9TELE|nr:C-type lectin domain family 4 member M-like [Parambassis ranga]